MLESEIFGTKKVDLLRLRSLHTTCVRDSMRLRKKKSQRNENLLVRCAIRGKIEMLKGIVSGDQWHLCQFLAKIRHHLNLEIIPYETPRLSSYFAVPLSTTKFWLLTEAQIDRNLRIFGETLLWIFQSNSYSGQKRAGGTEKCHDMVTEIMINRV